MQLLATTASLVGEDRALAAAQGVLGSDGLAELLSFLEPAALSAPVRRDLDEHKNLLKGCASRARRGPASRPPTLVPLRRISISNVLMAVGAILGVYLLIAQFSDVPNLGEILRGSEKGWLVVVALLSQLPQFAGAFVLLGSVATQLPYGPSLAVQFANNFTGFVAGSVGTTAMIIRYFQRQGLTIAIAVSSGVLKTLSGMVVQFTLIVIALRRHVGRLRLCPRRLDRTRAAVAGDLILLLIIVAGVALGVVVTVPKLRRRVHRILAPQSGHRPERT